MKHSKPVQRSGSSLILLVAFSGVLFVGVRVLAQSQEASSADYKVYSSFLKSQLAGHNGIDDLRVAAPALAPLV